MATVIEEIAKVRTALVRRLEQEQRNTVSDRAEIVRLTNLVNSGEATPEQKAALEELTILADAADPSNPQVFPPDA